MITSIRISNNDPVTFEGGLVHVRGNLDLGADAAITSDLYVQGNVAMTDTVIFDVGTKAQIEGDLNVSGTAVLAPGTYDDVSVSGTVEFLSGVYDFRTLSFGASAVGWTAEPVSATDWEDSGVVFRLLGPSEDVANCMTLISSVGPPAGFNPSTCTNTGVNVLDITGNTQLDLHVLNRNIAGTNLNDYNSFLIYAPFNSLDLTGTGDRDLDGSIYAPTGRVDISGDGGDAIVEGQVMAYEIRFSGNGPLVDHEPGAPKITFGPVLVNTLQENG